ncbi:MAG: aminotransferase class I/II-fold pyridoxal phosphate-dependent enzyme [Chloroflexota bacterium]
MRIEDFKLERWMSRWETRVTHDIAESGILPMSVNDLLDLLPEAERAETRDRLLALPLGYSEARGTEALREALAATYEGTTAENVLITTGAIEANYLLFNVLLQPGDEVVTIDPAYQQVQSVPAAIGADVKFWRIRSDDGFRFDLEDFERLLTPRTRLISINTPHNPTGAILDDEALQHVYEVAASMGATVLSDEAYRWLDIPGGDAMPSPMRNRGELGISVGTVSKPFGVPGLRIGWIVAPEPVIQRCWALRDYITLSPGKLNDQLALSAVEHRDAIRARTHRIVAANMATADRWFADNAELASWVRPRAGLLALMRYHLDIPSSDLADLLAERYSVMLAPGSAFGFEHHLRIGVGQNPAIFAEGLDRTRQCFDDLQARGVRRLAPRAPGS